MAPKAPNPDVTEFLIAIDDTDARPTSATHVGVLISRTAADSLRRSVESADQWARSHGQSRLHMRRLMANGGLPQVERLTQLGRLAFALCVNGGRIAIGHYDDRCAQENWRRLPQLRTRTQEEERFFASAHFWSSYEVISRLAKECSPSQVAVFLSSGDAWPRSTTLRAEVNGSGSWVSLWPENVDPDRVQVHAAADHWSLRLADVAAWSCNRLLTLLRKPSLSPFEGEQLQRLALLVHHLSTPLPDHALERLRREVVVIQSCAHA